MSCHRQLILPVICLPGCSSVSWLCGSLWFHCSPFLVRGCCRDGWLQSAMFVIIAWVLLLCGIDEDRLANSTHLWGPTIYQGGGWFFFFFQGWLYWYESAEVLNCLVLKSCHGCWVFWVGFSRQLVKGSWVGRGCHSGLENSLKQHFLLADTMLTALCCRCFRGNIFSSEIAKSKDISLL